MKKKMLYIVSPSALDENGDFCEEKLGRRSRIMLKVYRNKYDIEFRCPAFPGKIIEEKK